MRHTRVIVRPSAPKKKLRSSGSACGHVSAAPHVPRSPDTGAAVKRVWETAHHAASRADAAHSRAVVHTSVMSTGVWRGRRADGIGANQDGSWVSSIGLATHVGFEHGVTTHVGFEFGRSVVGSWPIRKFWSRIPRHRRL